MKLLVTGAGGFLGRHVVAAALARGHTVRALVRPASALPAWAGDAGVEVVRADLRARHGLEPVVAGVDAVLHLAAAKSGDVHDQFAATVMATEHLLAAMAATGVNHIVLASSFSVYDYLNRRSGSVLDEDAPLEPQPQRRDAYCQTKLAQERLVRETASAHGWRCTVLRPGVIWGSGELLTARIGMALGPRWWLRTGAHAALPLTHVEHCAEAFVRAAETAEAPGERVLNVVDDETPTQRAYLAALRRAGAVRSRVLPLPWWLLRLSVACADAVDRRFFDGTLRLPALLRPASLHARCKPLRYPNRRMREALGWAPPRGWREALARSVDAAPSPAHTAVVDPAP